MPYITNDSRDQVNKQIDELLLKLSFLDSRQIDGIMNYIISRLIDGVYSGGGYQLYSRAIGMLDCVSKEYYRRKVAPYEDIKKEENGDVYR